MPSDLPASGFRSPSRLSPSLFPAKPRLANFFSGPRAAPERPLPPEGRSRRPREWLSLSLSRGMNGLVSGVGEMAIRLMRTAGMTMTRALFASQRILTQNRHPLLLNAPLVTDFSRRDEV